MKLFIDTDWYDIIQDLPKEKQIEIMEAILAFPNGKSNTHIWQKVIKPQLEHSAKLYQEKSERFAENRKKRWQQKSEQISEQISDKKYEQTLNKCQNVNVNVKDNIINKINKNTSSIWNTRATPTQEQVLEYAAQQNEIAGMGGFAVTQEQAQDFYDYYSGIGWVLPNDAKTPIVDWKPFLRKWVRNPRFVSAPVKSANDDAYEADLRFLAHRKRDRELAEQKRKEARK